MASFAAKNMRFLNFLLAANYYLSVLLLVSTAAATLSGNDFLFKTDTNLYGPLANNLRLVLIYLALIDISISAYCYLRNQYYEILILGSFIILLVGLLEFYSVINQIPIGTTYRMFFIYIGLSHILFGLVMQIKHNYPTSHKG